MKHKVLKVHFPGCIVFKQKDDGPTQFSLVAPVADLDQVLAVSRRAESSSGYQRRQNRSRVRKIRKYLEAPAAVLPNAITVAFDIKGRHHKWIFRERKASGDVSWGDLELQLEHGAKAGVIIDGQHRFQAAKDFRADMPIAVTGLLDAEPMTQLVHFVVINNKATRVSGGHLNNLMGDVAHLEAKDRARFEQYMGQLGLKDLSDADIVASLNEKEGAFEGLLDFESNEKGIISSTVLRALVKASKKNGVLSRIDQSEWSDAFDAICTGFRRRYKTLFEAEVAARRKPKDKKLKKAPKQKLLHSATIHVLFSLLDQNLANVNSLRRWKGDFDELENEVVRFLKRLAEKDIQSAEPDNTTLGRKKLTDDFEEALLR